MRLTFLQRMLAGLILLVCAMLLHAGSAHSGRALKLGVFIMDPMVVKDAEGRFHGAVVKVAEHIAKLEGWDLEVVQCDFHQCLSMIESGELDLASPVAFTEKRARRYAYINETLIMDWGQIYAGADQNINTIMDLQGKRVVALKESVFYNNLMHLLESFDVGAEVTFVSDYLDVFRYVEDGRADAMVLNRMFGEKNIEKFEHVIKTPIIFMPIDIRYVTPNGKHKDIREALDRRLRELKAAPTSEYYRAMDRMLGGGAHGFHLPHWVSWVALGSGGLLLLLFGLSVAFKRQVNKRTLELRQENNERRLAERALFESRESFKALVEFTSAIHWELDIKTREFIYVSPQAEKMLGYPSEQWKDFEFWASIIHPDDRVQAVEYCNVETRSGKDHEFTYRAMTADGRVVWLRDIVKVIMGDSGPEKLIGIMLDITENKLSEERTEASLREKEVLLKEIHHRVKNNMAIISSLSSLQANYVKDVEALRILKEGRARIRAMALVHEQLYQSKNLSEINVAEYLERLIKNIMRSYAVKDCSNIKIDCTDLRLGLDELVPCGLVINELLTNAVKYAYEEPCGGEILVSMKQGAEKACVLEVRDSGRGLPEGIDLDKPETLGLRLVKVLAAQLEADLAIKSEGGLSVRLEFGFMD